MDDSQEKLHPKLTSIEWVVLRGPLEVQTKRGLYPLIKGDIVGWHSDGSMYVGRRIVPTT
jgi:hypothetical protein